MVKITQCGNNAFKNEVIQTILLMTFNELFSKFRFHELSTSLTKHIRVKRVKTLSYTISMTTFFELFSNISMDVL